MPPACLSVYPTITFNIHYQRNSAAFTACILMGEGKTKNTLHFSGDWEPMCINTAVIHISEKVVYKIFRLYRDLLELESFLKILLLLEGTFRASLC